MFGADLSIGCESEKALSKVFMTRNSKRIEFGITLEIELRERSRYRRHYEKALVRLFIGNNFRNLQFRSILRACDLDQFSISFPISSLLVPQLVFVLLKSFEFFC